MRDALLAGLAVGGALALAVATAYALEAAGADLSFVAIGVTVGAPIVGVLAGVLACGDGTVHSAWRRALDGGVAGAVAQAVALVGAMAASRIFGEAGMPFGRLDAGVLLFVVLAAVAGLTVGLLRPMPATSPEGGRGVMRCAAR